MTKDAIQIKLNRILKLLFPKTDFVFDESMTAANIPGWNSLTHVKFLIAVEEEFNIKFSLQEFSQFKNLSDLINSLMQKVGPT